jgi:hypothetical protein
MKKPDLLILVAIWEFITAFLAFIGLAAIATFAFPEVSTTWGREMVGGYFGLGLATLVLLCYIGISVAGGIGLLIGKEWGRILSIVQAVLSMICIPIGTIIGILALIYLISTDVKNYFSDSISKT